MRRFVTFVFLIISLSLLGCLESIINEIRYEEVPTSLEFKISYGYYINSSGKGDFKIDYICLLPIPLSGYVKNFTAVGNYTYKEIDGNRIIHWYFNESGNKNIKLGIECKVKTSPFLVDLDPSKSISIENISLDLKNRYCKDQSIENKTLIQPSDYEIRGIASSLKNSDNAFDVAMNIFKWLKKNMTYAYHSNQTLPQSAKETLYLKSGDCDDLSILYISLCRSVDIPSRLVKGYIIEKVNGKYIAIPHAWAEVYVGFGKDGWIPVECAGTSKDVEIEIHQNFGVEDASHLRIYVDNGTDESLTISNRGVRIVYESGITIDMQPFLDVDDLVIEDNGGLIVKKNGERLYS